MGFAEILIIGVIAVLFLGPDKLPETMIQIAKFFKSVKTTVASAKSSIEEELHLEEIKKEANSYKEQLNAATQELTESSGVNELKESVNEIKQGAKLSLDEPVDLDDTPTAPETSEPITFAKKTKKAKKKPLLETESKTTPSEDA